MEDIEQKGGKPKKDRKRKEKMTNPSQPNKLDFHNPNPLTPLARAGEVGHSDSYSDLDMDLPHGHLNLQVWAWLHVAPCHHTQARIGDRVEEIT